MPAAPTQRFLEIEDIKEGVVILRDRTLRGVLMVSSINFALKSEEEQAAIIYQFQNFLNSLDFPIQILIQSRRVNITGYLDKIKSLEEKQPNELLKYQTREYHKFVQSLVGRGDIYTKTFFVVVPFYPSEILVGKKQAVSLTDELFQKAKVQLWQRLEFVAMGLKRCGLQCTPLNTLELIELFWSFYHPQEAEVGYYPEIPPELTT
jgi:type IV secretory pathway VirB4 component